MSKNLGILAVLVLLVLWLISNYNGLVSQSLQVDQQFAQVQTQYQRRFDLIPNLENSVKAVLKQEQQIFKDLADARSRYAGAQTQGSEEKIAASQNYDSAISRLLVIMENYPQLKSNETVQKFMDELAGTENRISVERKNYNEVVTTFNTSVMRFPGNLFAKLFGFAPKQLFNAESSAQTAPKVNLGN